MAQMIKLEYQGEQYNCRENETVLQAFLRQGVDVPFSCGNGICHVCMQRCAEGDVPEVAQKGLWRELQQRGLDVLDVLPETLSTSLVNRYLDLKSRGAL